MAVTLTKVAPLYNMGSLTGLDFTLAFSGTYPTGGETVNFAAGFPNIPGKAIPVDVNINGVSGFIYTYANGTDITNGKVQVYCNTAGGSNAPLGEHTNASYVAGVTGDTINGFAHFKNLGSIN
jgi:hypothetical protein